MAPLFFIDISHSIVHITVDGRMDQHVVLDIIETFVSDARYQSQYGILFDVCKNDYFPSYSEVVSFYHEYHHRFSRKISGKMAFIVCTTLQYGIARMASTVLSSALPNVDVFLTKEEGLRWLQSP